MNERIEKAKQFAHEAHDSIGQKRKYSGEPYWVHTDAVAALVAENGGTEDMVVAAHLHDVVEDVTPKDTTGLYNYHNIAIQFGRNVAEMVLDLSDTFTKEAYPKLNRAARHKLENERLEKIRVESKIIKICDLISNTESIVEHDKDFARVYLREKFETLPYLSDGNPALLQRASMQTLAGFASLGLTIPYVGA